MRSGEKLFTLWSLLWAGQRAPTIPFFTENAKKFKLFRGIPPIYGATRENQMSKFPVMLTKPNVTFSAPYDIFRSSQSVRRRKKKRNHYTADDCSELGLDGRQETTRGKFRLIEGGKRLILGRTPPPFTPLKRIDSALVFCTSAGTYAFYYCNNKRDIVLYQVRTYRERIRSNPDHVLQPFPCKSAVYYICIILSLYDIIKPPPPTTTTTPFVSPHPAARRVSGGGRNIPRAI